MANCVGRWAEAWEYQVFWCKSSLITGTHSGGNASGFLSNPNGEFLAVGIRANVGMVLYNLTDLSSGPVTAVDDTQITATLTGGTNNLWDTGDLYRIVPLSAQEIAGINSALDITASDVSAVVASRGACNCAMPSWATDLLKKFNFIEAAMFHSCSCSGPSSTPEERQQWRDWMQVQQGLIMRGEIDLCGGTGSNTPAFGVAQQAVNDFAAVRIITNRRLRGLS